ncbi:M28 family metallopeptidase [Guptibacillus algicola]|uniref:M28 family metallopeptidase n=1 Tax=Guptibacillus algicola TaxID=225844 RepID=UPI001CD32B00|nr:M28 family metallopeptidase [Alkalihalobacillus algicola]MCA0988477.1 M28 family metallopeptidase [Alkalihalobacillus algicola]
MEPVQTRLMKHMNMLSSDIGCRPVGSEANLAASDYIERTFRHLGLKVETQEFEVPNWKVTESFIHFNDKRVEARCNNFSEPCDVTGEVLSFCTVEELETSQDLTGKIAFLYGELSKENYVPKGFTIYNPEHHRKVVSLLEEKQPSAIIMVQMQKGNDLPIFNDWDFPIPSVTVTPEVGLLLRNNMELRVRCVINSERSPGKTKNVIGRVNGERPEKIILVAHYDTVFETNGAFDNASGVSVMLALAEEIVKRKELTTGFECIAFSSEEYLGLGDEVYLKNHKENLQHALVAMNFDGVGQALGTNNITLMSGSTELESELQSLKRAYPGVHWTSPWYESNHYTFFSNNVPSIPFSCCGVADLLHTDDDKVEWICPEKLAEVHSIALDVITNLQDKSSEWLRESKQEVSTN